MRCKRSSNTHTDPSVCEETRLRETLIWKHSITASPELLFFDNHYSCDDVCLLSLACKKNSCTSLKFFLVSFVFSTFKVACIFPCYPCMKRWGFVLASQGNYTPHQRLIQKSSVWPETAEHTGSCSSPAVINAETLTLRFVSAINLTSAFRCFFISSVSALYRTDWFNARIEF